MGMGMNISVARVGDTWANLINLHFLATSPY